MSRLVTIFSVLTAIAAGQSIDYNEEYCTKIEFLYRPSYASYIALGDSYAVGLGSLERLQQCQGSEPLDSPVCTSSTLGNTCNKDEGSYAYQFATKHVAPGGFAFAACSGANTTDLLESQLQFVQSQELLTVQIGGDDYSAFTNVLSACLLQNNCTGAVDSANATLQTVLSTVDDTLRAINTRVSNTTTKALVGYLEFFGYEDDCGIYIADFNTTLRVPLESRRAVNNLVALANKGLKNVASRRGFLFIDANAGYDGHRWCDYDSPYFFISNYTVMGVDSAGQSYSETAIGHPTYEGQQQYLEALETVLRLS